MHTSTGTRQCFPSTLHHGVRPFRRSHWPHRLLASSRTGSLIFLRQCRCRCPALATTLCSLRRIIRTHMPRRGRRRRSRRCGAAQMRSSGRRSRRSARFRIAGGTRSCSSSGYARSPLSSRPSLSLIGIGACVAYRPGTGPLGARGGRLLPALPRLRHLRARARRCRRAGRVAGPRGVRRRAVPRVRNKGMPRAAAVNGADTCKRECSSIPANEGR